jgi:hypothetical protein
MKIVQNTNKIVQNHAIKVQNTVIKVQNHIKMSPTLRIMFKTTKKKFYNPK